MSPTVFAGLLTLIIFIVPIPLLAWLARRARAAGQGQ
jgi:hypothetical protein